MLRREALFLLSLCSVQKRKFVENMNAFYRIQRTLKSCAGTWISRFESDNDQKILFAQSIDLIETEGLIIEFSISSNDVTFQLCRLTRYYTPRLVSMLLHASTCIYQS